MTEYPNRAAMAAARAKLLEEFPPVVSPFAWSGKTPREAIPVLAGGLLLGVVAAAALGGAALGLGLLVVTPIERVLMGGARRAIAISFLLLVATALLKSGVLAFAAVSILYRTCVWARCRSRSLYLVLALMATLLATLLLGWATGGWLLPAFEKVTEGALSPDLLRLVLGTGYPVAIAVACAGSLCLGWLIARPLSEKGRFCEACEQQMDLADLGVVSLPGLRTLRELAQQRRMREAAELLRSGSGTDSEVVLVRCGGCGVGGLEAAVQFQAEWPKDTWSTKVESTEQEWLVLAVPLGPEEVRSLIGQRETSPAP